MPDREVMLGKAMCIMGVYNIFGHPRGKKCTCVYVCARVRACAHSYTHLLRDQVCIVVSNLKEKPEGIQ